MHEKRILNIVLAAIAGLLLLNLGAMFSPSAHAIPKTQYKAISMGSVTPTDNPGIVQQVLNQESAEGWSYVDTSNGVMIFRK